MISSNEKKSYKTKILISFIALFYINQVSYSFLQAIYAFQGTTFA